MSLLYRITAICAISLGLCSIITSLVFAAPVYTVPPAPSSIGSAAGNLGIQGILSSNCTTGVGCGVFNTNASGVDYAIFIIFTLAFSVAGLIAIIMIVRAGLSYMTNSGDRGALEKSRSSLVRALVGLVIIGFSYFLAQYLFSLVHLPSLFSTGSFESLFNSNFNLP